MAGWTLQIGLFLKKVDQRALVCIWINYAIHKLPSNEMTITKGYRYDRMNWIHFKFPTFLSLCQPFTYMYCSKIILASTNFEESLHYIVYNWYFNYYLFLIYTVRIESELYLFFWKYLNSLLSSQGLNDRIIN